MSSVKIPQRLKVSLHYRAKYLVAVNAWFFATLYTTNTGAFQKSLRAENQRASKHSKLGSDTETSEHS